MPTTPKDYAGAQLWLPTAHKLQMWQENTGVAGATRPNDNDPVGQIIDPVSGFIAGTDTDAERPTWDDNSNIGNLLFGSGDLVEIINSASLMRYLHQNGQLGFTIGLAVRFTNSQASVAQVLLDTSGFSSSNVGLSIWRNTNENIIAQGYNGSGLIWSITSSVVVNDTNWHRFWMTCDGSRVDMYIDDNPADSDTTLGAGSGDVNMAADLHIAGRVTESNFGLCRIANLIILDQVIAADDLTHWRSYEPDQTSDPISELLPSSGRLGLGVGIGI